MKQIFIQGILPRCGTNFLYRLLKLHSECKTLEYLGEDHIVRHAQLLYEYAGRVSGHWNPAWMRHKDRLIASLGKGLQQFFQPEAHDGFWLTKTPDTHNIDRFFELFPDAYLIIVIRNGRDLTESGARSFKWRYETAFRDYDKSGKRILDLQESLKDKKGKFLLVKYEDLHLNPAEAVKQVLDFCDLAHEAYQWDALNDLPVFGSSSYGRDGKVSWQPVEKSQAFNPMERSKNWSKGRHYRYNRICGETAALLGYENTHTEKGIVYQLVNLKEDFLNIFRAIYDGLKPWVKRYVYDPSTAKRS